MPATVTEDRTFTATYTPIEYDIVYIMNDGTNNPANPDTYTIETPTITLEDPTRDGYTFDGWTPGDSIPQGSTGTKTFTAHWKENFTITFNEGAHGSITTQNVFVLPDGSPFPTPPGVTDGCRLRFRWMADDAGDGNGRQDVHGDIHADRVRHRIHHERWHEQPGEPGYVHDRDADDHA